jgi:hypothetical protein
MDANAEWMPLERHRGRSAKPVFGDRNDNGPRGIRSVSDWCSSANDSRLK